MFALRKKSDIAFVGYSREIAARYDNLVSKEIGSILVCLLKKSENWSDQVRTASTVFVEVLSSSDVDMIELAARNKVKGQRFIVISNELKQGDMRRLMQMGVADWLTIDATDEEILSACLARTTGIREGARNIFAFTPVLGGMGATTLAIESALIMASRGRSSTCVIDLDFYAGECADYLNIEAKLFLDGLSTPPEQIDDHFLDSVMSEHSSGIKLLAAQTHLGSNQIIRSDSVLHLLNLVSARFDNIIIDLPRAWYDWTDEVILGSDYLFLISDASVPALRAAKRQINEYRQRYVGKIMPRVIVNKKERGWLSSSVSESDLKATLESQYAGSISDDTNTAKQAINRGVPISSLKGNARLIQDLKKIIDPLIKK